MRDSDSLHLVRDVNIYKVALNLNLLGYEYTKVCKKNMLTCGQENEEYCSISVCTRWP